jgi:hypothetical protein
MTHAMAQEKKNKHDLSCSPTPHHELSSRSPLPLPHCLRSKWKTRNVGSEFERPSRVDKSSIDEERPEQLVPVPVLFVGANQVGNSNSRVCCFLEYSTTAMTFIRALWNPW